MGGGGILAKGNCTVTLINNTIAYNSTKNVGGGICTHGDGGAATFTGKNNIIYHNSAKDNTQYGSVYSGGTTTLTYSCISQTLTGTGNIEDDPMFLNSDEDDYHLKNGSPCIDAGDPNSPLDPDNTRADMGALYYDQGTGIIIENPFVSQFEYNIYQANSGVFNQAITICYQLPHAVNVELVINNAAGQKVCAIVNSRVMAGSHQVIWDGKNDAGYNVVPGIYFYRFSAGSYRDVLKIPLVR